MSKGLKVALLTVAVGFMGFYAMAFAPVIRDIPSPIVGDAEDVTTPNSFEFPDAIDLDIYVSDDFTADADLRWSYEVGTPQRYSINGVDPIDSSTEDPAVPGAKAINTQVLGGELNPDGDPATITIRDIILSPLGGSNTDPGAAGYVADQVVTLYASDGSTYSSKNVLFYTFNDEEDSLSRGGTGTVIDIDVPGVVMVQPFPLAGSTLTTVGDAACIEVALVGNNYGEWLGSYGDLILVQNAVWQIRATVTSSQSTAGTVPFWDLIVDNFSQDGLSGQNAWGQDCLFLDNEGGANAASIGRTEFQVWFTPPQVLTSEFNDPLNGMFSDTWSQHKDARLRFRVLDANVNPGITADNDLGTMCLTEWEIIRFDIDDAQVGTTELDTTITAAEFDPTATAGSWSFDAGAETATYTPNSTAISDLYAELWYGEDALDYGNPATLRNSFPIPFSANTLYEVTYELSAPTQEAEDSPPDVLFVAMDSPTNEVIGHNFFTPQMGGMGTPDLNEVTPYRFYYYSHSATNSGLGADAMFLRPRFFFINDTNIHNFPEGDTTNDGGVTVHSVRVRQVTFQ